MRNPFGSNTTLHHTYLKDIIKTKGPTTKKPTSDADVVQPPLTHWIRPPQGMEMEDGTQMGESGYVDPHAATMTEWENIDKGPTGGFRPDGTAILHSDPDSAHSLNLLGDANSSDSSTQGGGYGKKRKGQESRREMNLTGSRGSSILTS